jgi:hypothetical protein
MPYRLVPPDAAVLCSNPVAGGSTDSRPCLYLTDKARRAYFGTKPDDNYIYDEFGPPDRGLTSKKFGEDELGRWS